MECLIFLCITFSLLNLYLLLKKSTDQHDDTDQHDFKKYTETLITEFNRITTRNVSMLDERITALNQKIRLSHKMESCLKEQLEKITQETSLKELDSVIMPPISSITTDPEEQKSPKDHLVFEGIPIGKLEQYKYASIPSDKKKAVLKYHLHQNHITKEDLLNLGFSTKEINLISLFPKEKEE